MSVQLPNGVLGVRRVDQAAVDAHGSPVPGAPAGPTAAFPGKIAELDTGGWQLALDPRCWPVRVGDVIVAGDGREWTATSVKYVGTPALTPQEGALGLDLDVSFVRVMAAERTPAGTEPGGAEFVGRVGYP